MYSSFSTACHNIDLSRYGCSSWADYALNLEGINFFPYEDYFDASPDYKIEARLVDDAGNITMSTAHYMDVEGPSQGRNEEQLIAACDGVGSWQSSNDDARFRADYSATHLGWFEATGQAFTCAYVTRKTAIPTDDRRVLQMLVGYERTSDTASQDCRLRWEHTTTAEASNSRRIRVEFSGWNLWGVNNYNPYQPHLIIVTNQMVGNVRHVNVWIDGVLECSGTNTISDWEGYYAPKSGINFGDGGLGDDRWYSAHIFREVFDQDDVDAAYAAYARNFDPPLI